MTDKQRSIFDFVANNLKVHRQEFTQPIRGETLAHHCGTKVSVMRMLVNRMIQRSYLLRGAHYPGPTGGTQYSIPTPVYKEYLYSVAPETYNNPTTKPTTQASSSSINVLEDLTNTTNTSEFTDEWKNIDFSELPEELGLGFGEKVRKQCFARKLCDAKDFQESIWHFG